jgi:hypothetical protein
MIEKYLRAQRLADRLWRFAFRLHREGRHEWARRIIRRAVFIETRRFERRWCIGGAPASQG